MRVSQRDAEEIAKKQIETYSSVIAADNAVSLDVIRTLSDAASLLKPHTKYEDYAEIRFIWEMLVMKENTEVVKGLVDAWIQSESNIKRAAQQVNRALRPRNDIVSGFGIFRMKPRDGQDWVILDDHGRVDTHDTDAMNPQTVVFIALTHLSFDNGFFVSLEPGQDVCIDSAAKIIYPPTGGGVGVAIWLKL